MQNINQFDDAKIINILSSDAGYSEFINSLADIPSDEQKFFLDKISDYAIKMVERLTNSDTKMSGKEWMMAKCYYYKFLKNSLVDSFINGNGIEIYNSIENANNAKEEKNRQTFRHLCLAKDPSNVLVSEWNKYYKQVESNSFDIEKIDRLEELFILNIEKIGIWYFRPNTVDMVYTYFRNNSRGAKLADKYLQMELENESLLKEDYKIICKMFFENDTLNEETKIKILDNIERGEIKVDLPEGTIQEIILDEELYKRYKSNIERLLPSKAECFEDIIDGYIKEKLYQEAKSEKSLTDEDKAVFSSYFKKYMADSLKRNLPQKELGIELVKGCIYAKYSGSDSEKKQFFTSYANYKSEVWDKITEFYNSLAEPQNEKMDVKSIDNFAYLLFMTFLPGDRICQLLSRSVDFISSSEELNLSDQKSMEIFIGRALVEQAQRKGTIEQEEATAKYLEGMLKESVQTLIESDAIAQIHTMLIHNRLSDNLAMNVSTIIEKATESIEVTKEEKSSKRVSSNMQQDEFDDFVEFVKKIRIKEGIIPREYCDCIIRHVSDKKNSEWILTSQYNGIKVRAVEDFTHSIMKEKGINDYYCAITANQDEFSYNIQGNDMLGQAEPANKCIRLNRSSIEILSSKCPHMINTIFHEVRHVQQKKERKDDIFSYNTYLILKEEILKGKYPEFYKKNYSNLFLEIDARICGRQEQYAYLAKLGLDLDTILDGATDKSLASLIKSEIFKEQGQYADGREKFIEDNTKKVNADDFFDDLVSREPNLVKDNQQLQVEYKLDGSKKGIGELFKDFDEKLSSNEDSEEKDKLVNFYTGLILEKRDYIAFEKLAKESKEVMDFISENKIVTQMREKYLKKLSGQVEVHLENQQEIVAEPSCLNKEETMSFFEKVDLSVTSKERYDAMEVLLKAVTKEKQDITQLQIRHRNKSAQENCKY